MDSKTLKAYDAKAKDYAEDWLSQPTPQEIHDLARSHFKAGLPTADIGSGSGRDTAWLSENGFPCTGYDASEGLLAVARKKFPKLDFEMARLPALKEIASDSFDNVLCETVLMHLSSDAHEAALRSLLRILKPGGTLSLSWRHPRRTKEDGREDDGRLYAHVDGDKLVLAAEAAGAHCLHRDSIVSPSSGKRIEQLVLRKT
jgi:ubiquinone/menaquinone biosynthesis C-methylase UbiE